MNHWNRLWTKYKEYVLYVVFGAGTTVVSWGVFYVCGHWLGMSVVLANVISWILAVAFAYVTNRIWVFESRNTGIRAILLEIGEFVSGRLLTLGIETVFLWLTVDIIGWNDMLMKILISILVIILNYFFSKWIVFKRKDRR